MGDDFYLDADLQATRDPDFSSSVGYDDWHPYTLSQVYANYKDYRLCHPKQAAAFHGASAPLAQAFSKMAVLCSLFLVLAFEAS